MNLLHKDTRLVVINARGKKAFLDLSVNVFGIGFIIG